MTQKIHESNMLSICKYPWPVCPYTRSEWFVYYARNTSFVIVVTLSHDLLGHVIENCPFEL